MGGVVDGNKIEYEDGGGGGVGLVWVGDGGEFDAAFAVGGGDIGVADIFDVVYVAFCVLRRISFDIWAGNGAGAGQWLLGDIGKSIYRVWIFLEVSGCVDFNDIVHSGDKPIVADKADTAAGI